VCAGAFQLLRGGAPAQLRGNVGWFPHTNAESRRYNTKLSSGGNLEDHYGENYGVIIIILICNHLDAANSVFGIPEMFWKYT
jgi:hypothetical protein